MTQISMNKNFVKHTYTAFLAWEHPMLAMEVNALCGLFCCIQAGIYMFICSKVCKGHCYCMYEVTDCPCAM